MINVQSRLEKVDNVIEWCKSNNYPYKISNYSIFWKTDLQTGEINVLTDEIKWHKLKYFDKIKG